MSKETWAEKFDEEFTVDGHGFECEGCCFDESREKVKAFISKVRQEAVLEERRRILSLPCMEEEKVSAQVKKCLHNGDMECNQCWQEFGSTFAANNLRSELKELINKEK